MPSVATKVNAIQQQQKINHDTSCKLREFDIGDNVDKWHGPVSYLVKLNDRTIVKQHMDHVNQVMTLLKLKMTSILLVTILSLLINC